MLPKISAVMPTAGTQFFPMALECWLHQDYAGELEIVIVDNADGENIWAVFDKSFLSSDRRIQYFSHARASVGALRNYGNSVSTGDIIITADEDDWSASNRVSEQVARLQASGVAVTGWHNILYYDSATGACGKYTYDARGYNHPPYACGTSQCYYKSWWEKHPFEDKGKGSDHVFSKEALHAHQLDSCDAGQLCVAVVHDRNTCPKLGYVGHHRQFPAVERAALPKEFFLDFVERKAAQIQIPIESGQE